MTERWTGETGFELSRLTHWDGLIQGLTTAIAVTDAAGRIVIWNRSAEDLYGWPSDDVLGRPILTLLLPTGAELDAVAVLATVLAGERWTDEVHGKRRDGTRVPVRLSVRALYDDAGEALGFVCESVDLSDLEAAEQSSRDAEALFRALLMRASEVACVTDTDGVIKQVFQTKETSLGYVPDDLTGRSGCDLVHEDDIGALKQAMVDIVADPTLHPSLVYRVRADDGSWHWRETRLSNRLDDPVVDGIVCNVADVTEHQEMIAGLRAADARQRAIVARSSDATMFFDGAGTVQWASPATTKLLGITPEELVGRIGIDFVHPHDRERALAEFSEMRNLGDQRRIEVRITDPRGEVHWVEQDAINLLDDPDVGFVVVNVRDITSRKRDHEQLARLTLHDPVTGLPNRSLVVNRLEQLIARKSSPAVLYIDIDNFGDVNDSLGHALGDELLRLIGSRLAAAVHQSSSTLARVGGDEFVLLCDDVRDATTAFSVAEVLRESLRLPFVLEGRELFVAASIGVALSPGDATGLMRDAGIATHQAKQRGRDRVAMFDARLDGTERDRLTSQSELRHALQRRELRVWYQPIIDMRTDCVDSVEALVRWQHPERGLLGPQHFIEIAEASGLIRDLGSQVLRQACTDARGWQDRGCPLRISVNAAAAQLSSPAFVDEIESALDEFEIDPDQVTIEITETAAMQVADSVETLHRIRRLGLHLALDDFGTGYSSLSFLRELPIDTIKIDRSFISGLGTSERDSSIVQGVLAIAVALGHGVVAEGIETTAQADLLRELGCSYAQGFLWSRPVPADQVQAVANQIPCRLEAVH